MTAQAQTDVTDDHTPGDGAGDESRDVRGQVLFRQLNEEIRSLANGFSLDAEIDLVCECTHGGCFQRLTISTKDYEEIRRFPTRFIVKPGHAEDEVERIVEETLQFLVVEKIGAEALTAICLDPRRPARGPEEVHERRPEPAG